MIRKSVLGASVAALLLASAGASFAADIPGVAPQQAAVTGFDWTGFYAGAQVGYGWSTIGLRDADGFLGGLHAGYNHQIGNWVFGAEADAEISAVEATLLENAWLGSVRGRIGYAFDRTLVYTTAGVAFGSFEIGLPGIVSDKNTHVGWTAGLGLEYAISQNISARAEYRFSDLGAKTYNIGGLVGSADMDENHTVRTGVSYKF